MARFAMNTAQKIRAAMQLSNLADEEGKVDLTLKEIAALLQKELGLDQQPSDNGVVTIMEGAGLDWKKPERSSNLPMVQVWNAIKDLQARVDALENAEAPTNSDAMAKWMREQHSRMETMQEEIRKLQLVAKQ